MSIEFRCPQCQKLLRVSDDAAGAAADCPGCGNPLTVPGGRAPTVDTLYDGGANDPLFAPLPTPPPRSVDDNPYRAPAAPRTYTKPGAPAAKRSGRRDGPAWERDGMSPFSFVRTVTELFFSPIHFFKTMRRDEGIGAPLTFYLLMQIVPTVAVMFLGGHNPAVQRLQIGGGVLTKQIILAVAMFVVGTCAVLIGAGIFHVGLSIVGGAKESFETTFRVFAYAGASGVFQLIPVAGQVMDRLALLAFLVIGFMYAHDIGFFRAVFAIIVPLLGCIGLTVIFIVFAQAIINQMPAQPPAGGARMQLHVPNLNPFPPTFPLAERPSFAI